MIIADIYAKIFTAKAQSFYAPGGVASCPSVWIEPSTELHHSFKSLKNIEVMGAIAERHSVYVPAIEEFLEDEGVQALSFHVAGTEAATYRCLVTKKPYTQDILRIGHGQRNVQPPPTENIKPDYKHLQKWNRPWCPLVLQPYDGSTRLLKPYGMLQPQLERLPFVAVLDEGRARDFGTFINEFVLRGTPYAVLEDKDCGALRGGIPVYVDPSSLNFKTPELAHQYANDQFRDDYQQDVMSTIDKNTREAELPHPFRWAVKKEDGRYVTAQSLLCSEPEPPRQRTRQIMKLAS